VRDKRALTDHACRGKPENRVVFAIIAIAPPIAHIVRTQITCTQMISFPRRPDFTERVSTTRLIVRTLKPQARRHLCRPNLNRHSVFAAGKAQDPGTPPPLRGTEPSSNADQRLKTARHR
jgi:hypothetical protein